MIAGISVFHQFVEQRHVYGFGNTVNLCARYSAQTYSVTDSFLFFLCIQFFLVRSEQAATKLLLSLSCEWHRSSGDWICGLWGTEKFIVCMNLGGTKYPNLTCFHHVHYHLPYTLWSSLCILRMSLGQGCHSGSTSHSQPDYRSQYLLTWTQP